MSQTAFLLFGLIMMSQVKVLYSVDTGICYLCKDYLNALQCNNNPNCSFKGGLCTTLPVNATATVTVANPSCASQNSTICFGMDGTSTTMQCYVNNGKCSSFDNSKACSTYSTNTNLCQQITNCIVNQTAPTNSSASCLTTSCTNLSPNSCNGNDGVNPKLVCYVPSNPNLCASVDGTQACSTFNSYQCNSVAGCLFTPTNANVSMTVGSCAPATCAQFTSQSTCIAFQYSTNFFSVRPCKYVPSNSTSNTSSCVTGSASDISKGNCDYYPLWFTYSDAQNTCTGCTEILGSSSAYILSQVAIGLLVIALSH